MILINRLVNSCRRSQAKTFALLLTAIWVIVLSGCEKKPTGSGLGSVTGVAQLSVPDPMTGHTGILMFLAGTPFYARTDQQGRYRIDGIPAGTYDLVAEKPGFQTQVINNVFLDPQEHDTDSPLSPPAALLTKVESQETTAADQSPGLGTIRGRVWLQNMNENDNGGVRVEVDGTAFVTVSSNNGQYRILNVDPGSYTLSFYREGYRPYTTEEVTVTSGILDIKETALEPIQPGDSVSPAAAAAAAAVVASTTTPPEAPPGPDEPRSIVGIVEARNAAGELLTDFSNVTIAINGTSLVATIDDQGQFRFDGLTSGTYTLIGTVDGGQLTQVPVDLETQRTASVKMTIGSEVSEIPTSGSITGKVVLLNAEGDPETDASGVQVAIQGTQVIATTKADGNFALSGIQPGSYILSATKDGYEGTVSPSIAVEGLTPIDAGEIRLNLKLDRPRVISTDPVDGSRDVVVGFSLPITVKFNQKMNIDSVKKAISLSPSTPFTAFMGSGAGSGASDDTLVLSLSNESSRSPIQFGANYRITIAGSAANTDGVTMSGPHQFSFRTANPGVIQTFPENGANRVYLDQNQNPVLITFNTRLDPDSINDRTIRVRPDGGVSVSVTHTNSDSNGWTTVRIATQWQPNTAYTVTVSRRVKAFNKQPLGNTPFTLRFRTAPLEIMSMPALEVR